MANNGAGNQLLQNKFVRFLFSAGSGFVVDISAFYILDRFMFTEQSYMILGHSTGNHALALSVSFFLGVLVNFLITRYLVFSESRLPFMQQFMRFGLVAFVGYFANLEVLKLFIKYVHLAPPVARITAALSLFFASFFIHKFFSFNLSLKNNASRNH
ncbi:GtrA family protein [Mucilaginibacter sp. Bleaf8]|uniref:GtrA family protein n=1 Tax=Mucilaginibacter sp. Bleaf8 TaxID=2834430 RepID=UPI001BCEE73F|nr:GtrA family protein [Mucilaginibacter sp. Bleaf8]MBS7565226.1 GtrA family protein [Mucilaginibacter sp. Bleaf8]